MSLAALNNLHHFATPRCKIATSVRIQPYCYWKKNLRCALSLDDITMLLKHLELHRNAVHISYITVCIFKYNLIIKNLRVTVRTVALCIVALLIFFSRELLLAELEIIAYTNFKKLTPKFLYYYLFLDTAPYHARNHHQAIYTIYEYVACADIYKCIFCNPSIEAAALFSRRTLVLFKHYQTATNNHRCLIHRHLDITIHEKNRLFMGRFPLQKVLSYWP